MIQYPCKPMKCKRTEIIWPGKRIVEIKKDGDRTFAVKQNDQYVLYSSAGNDVSMKYPEITRALKHLNSDDFIVDGEIVAVDESWNSLHKRSDEGISNSSVYFSIFDVLRVEGLSLSNLVLSERKQVLSELVDDTPQIQNMPFEMMNYRESMQFFSSVVDRGLEGIVVKQPDSMYQPGARNESWIKVKRSDNMDCQVIGLTKSDKENRLFAAVVLASNGFYLGKAGTGFDEVESNNIVTKVTMNSGFNGVILPNDVQKELMISCRPLWCRIKFQEKTEKSIRHPVWNGFRNDPSFKEKT